MEIESTSVTFTAATAQTTGFIDPGKSVVVTSTAAATGLQALRNDKLEVATRTAYVNATLADMTGMPTGTVVQPSYDTLIDSYGTDLTVGQSPVTVTNNGGRTLRLLVWFTLAPKAVSASTSYIIMNIMLNGGTVAARHCALEAVTGDAAYDEASFSLYAIVEAPATSQITFGTTSPSVTDYPNTTRGGAFGVTVLDLPEP